MEEERAAASFVLASLSDALQSPTGVTPDASPASASGARDDSDSDSEDEPLGIVRRLAPAPPGRRLWCGGFFVSADDSDSDSESEDELEDGGKEWGDGVSALAEAAEADAAIQLARAAGRQRESFILQRVRVRAVSLPSPASAPPRIRLGSERSAPAP